MASAHWSSTMSKTPLGYISKTGHGTYFRENITPELVELEHGGRKMWTPVVDAAVSAAKDARIKELEDALQAASDAILHIRDTHWTHWTAREQQEAGDAAFAARAALGDKTPNEKGNRLA